MSKFTEDKADPQLNIGILNKEFNIDENCIVDTETGEIFELEGHLTDIKDMRKELAKVSDEMGPDPDKIICDNIDRANRLLDKIEDQIMRGDINARMFEVSAQLIGTITAAATSITGISYNQQVIDNKNRALDIKERELQVKAIKQDVSGNIENMNVTNNNLVMTREQLMEMLK